MGSPGIQRSNAFTSLPATATPQRSNSLRSATAPPSASSTASTGPSQRAQRQVQASRAQTAQQLASPETAQAVSQAIEATPSSTLQENALHYASVIKDSPLTQGLVSTTQSAISTGAKLHDGVEAFGETLDAAGVAEPLGNVVDALTEKFNAGETEIPTLEAAAFERLTGISTESIGSLKEMVETGKQALQVAKTAQCLNDAYQSYGTAEFSGKVQELARVSYATLGGESTVELHSKVSAFCEKCDIDSGKEVMSALAKFSTDDSFIATTQRSALSWASGSGASSLMGQAVPVLSFGAAAIDTGMAAKTGYDWWQGKASGTELCKSSVTALGSVAGATVAPVIGPLAAAAINYGIDAAGSAYTSVSNWWNGSATA
jgi:hypothetical protein